MKYQEALKRRNLSVENLSKTLQKKIQELNKQILELEEIENIPEEELQDSDLKDIEQIKKNLQELDSYIEHKVNIFDQAKYEEKLEKVSKMTKAKQGIKQVEAVQKQEIEVKEPEVEEPIVEMREEPKLAPTPQPAPQPAPKPTYVAPPPPTPAPAPVYEEQQHDEEEFERKGEGKPKKMTTGILLMGVGAFFLTWGAVNFFKSRK